MAVVVVVLAVVVFVVSKQFHDSKRWTIVVFRLARCWGAGSVWRTLGIFRMRFKRELCLHRHGLSLSDKDRHITVMGFQLPYT